MSTKKKMFLSAAGAAAGEAIDVDDVFSTFLYEGNGSTKTITNGIDLSGEGGLVWTKSRETGYSHELIDTVRGIKKTLRSNGSDAEGTMSSSAGFSSFNSNGYSIAGQYGTWGSLSVNGEDHVSWTFRKAPKFFDVVTWSGNGVNGRTISHNLGSTPGMILVKRLDSADGWITYHRKMDASSPQNYAMFLNLSNARATETYWNNTAPTSTGFTVSSNVKLNGGSGTYVAYLFAHNDGDGEFGPDADQDIIECGSYTGNGSNDGPTINLGFEPQWLMIKDADASENWQIFDNMRGMAVGQYPVHLYPNSNAAEGTVQNQFDINSTGFKITFNSNRTNANGDNYIYVAIRRGPLAVPEDATKVFGIDKYEDGSGDGPTNGIVNDFSLLKAVSGSGNWFATSRLQGANRMKVDNTSAEASNSNAVHDRMDGVWNTSLNNHILWGWKRAPSYFDVVAYTGTGSNKTVTHNLGAVPEMMWLKNRETTNESWIVYHKTLGATKYAMLDKDDADLTNSTRFNDTAPTASVFTVGTDQSTNSPNGHKHMAYLFATAPGVSKVGSYTGTGSDGHIINCGFSSGARFILIRIVGTSGSWYIFDTTRGIVTGSDPYLKLDTNDAEASSDLIDPHSSGFIVNSSALINANGYTHIFYAIA